MAATSTYQPKNSFAKWFEARLPIVGLIHSSFVVYPTPRNLNYLWTFGGILTFCLLAQIITGVVLAMHYQPSATGAFDSVERIRREAQVAKWIGDRIDTHRQDPSWWRDTSPRQRLDQIREEVWTAKVEENNNGYYMSLAPLVAGHAAAGGRVDPGGAVDGGRIDPGGAVDGGRVDPGGALDGGRVDPGGAVDDGQPGDDPMRGIIYF